LPAPLPATDPPRTSSNARERRRERDACIAARHRAGETTRWWTSTRPSSPRHRLSPCRLGVSACTTAALANRDFSRRLLWTARHAEARRSRRTARAGDVSAPQL